LLILANNDPLTVSERNNDPNNVANKVMGIYDKNLPVMPGKTSIGMKTTILISDVMILGLAYVCIVMRIALVGSYHFFMFSRPDSMKTKTVSIPIPNDKINEKLVIKFILNPKKLRIMNVIKNEIGIATVAIILCLSPIKIAVIRNTKQIEVNPFHARLE
jgi:hypothetical protein